MENTITSNINELNKKVREIFKKANIDVDGLLVFNQEDAVCIDYNPQKSAFFTYSFEKGKRRVLGSFVSYIEAVRSLIRDFVPSQKEQEVFEALINDNRVNAKLFLFRFISSPRYLKKNIEGAIDVDYDTEKKAWYLYLFAEGKRNVLGYYDTFDRVVCAIIEKEMNEEREKRRAIRAVFNMVFI